MSFKHAFAAFAGANTTVNGRKLIDKLWNANFKDHAEWAGNDRPELHQNQACVEKGVTNEFRDSDPATDPGQGTRSNVTFAVNDWGIKYGTHDLNGKVVFGDNSVDRVYENGVLSSETTYTIRTLVKPDDGNAPTFGFGSSHIARLYIGAAINSGYTITPYTTGIWLVEVTATTGTVNLTTLGIRKITSNNAIGFEATAIQAEGGSYPTLYIPTTGSAVTRPAPLVPIGNFLPDTGYVTWLLEMVRLDGEIQQVFHTSGDDMTERSELALSADNAFYASIYGDEWGDGQGVLSRTNPFLDWKNGEKKVIVATATWNASNIKMYLADTDGQIYSYTRDNNFDINTDTIKDIYLGATATGTNHSSIRVLNKQTGTDYLDTEAKAKEKVQEITTGTYNVKSVNISTGAMGEDTEGHAGPTTLQAGNLDCGFFGEVTPEELFGTGNDSSWLISELGITQGSTLNQTRNWLKLAWEGKVIFYPMTSIQHSISWDHIYIKGCMYGTGQTISNAEREMLDNAIVEDGTTIYKDWLLENEGVDRIPQTAQVTPNGQTYRVRLMKGVNDDPAPGPSGRPGVGMENEWNRLILPLYFQTKDYNWQRTIDGTDDYSDYVNSKTPDWGVYYDDEDLLTHRDLSNGSYVWMQEFTKAHDPQRRVRRGVFGATYLAASRSWDASSLFGFRPVLQSE